MTRLETLKFRLERKRGKSIKGFRKLRRMIWNEKKRLARRRK